MRLGLALGLNGRRSSTPLTPGQALLAAAAYEWRAEDWSGSGAWADRRQGANATVLSTGVTKVASGATYTDNNSASQTADRDLILLGGSGGIALPYTPQLDLAEACTSLVLFRQRATPTSFRPILGGYSGSPNIGIEIRNNGTARQPWIAGYGNTPSDRKAFPSSTWTSTGVAGVAVLVDPANVYGWVDGDVSLTSSSSGAAANRAAAGDMTSAATAAIGANTNTTGFQKLELFAHAHWVTALTAAELQAVVDEWNAA